jgi:GTP1/Obg family GTP-binding protein
MRAENGRQTNGVMSMAARVKFDELKLDTEEAVIRVHERLVDFWTELARKEPTFNKLHDLGQSVHRLIADADKCYMSLLELNPSSVVIMREYANFLTKVTNVCGRPRR